ncbi:MAG: hypothetical protein F6K23_39955, partial [Okeania sp. SIO2C9]|uniref:hypothetical protein n=1 Tax=Okeania sp. SIO2C9 TaxID=2607791 RepID=UPI0013C20379
MKALAKQVAKEIKKQELLASESDILGPIARFIGYLAKLFFEGVVKFSIPPLILFFVALGLVNSDGSSQISFWDVVLGNSVEIPKAKGNEESGYVTSLPD